MRLKSQSRWILWSLALALGVLTGCQRSRPVPDVTYRSSRPALPPMSVLQEALSDEDAEVRLAAVISLGQLGKDASGAVGGLTERLKDSNANVRREAALTLGRLGTEAQGAEAAVVKLLSDENLDNRRVAAEVLGQIGAERQGTAEALSKALNDKDEDVREAAARSLRIVAPQLAEQRKLSAR